MIHLTRAAYALLIRLPPTLDSLLLSWGRSPPGRPPSPIAAVARLSYRLAYPETAAHLYAYLPPLSIAPGPRLRSLTHTSTSLARHLPSASLRFFLTWRRPPAGRPPSPTIAVFRTLARLPSLHNPLTLPSAPLGFFLTWRRPPAGRPPSPTIAILRALARLPSHHNPLTFRLPSSLHHCIARIWRPPLAFQRSIPCPLFHSRYRIIFTRPSRRVSAHTLPPEGACASGARRPRANGSGAHPPATRTHTET